MATLRFRRRTRIATASPARTLRWFDRALNASVGRTWIVYDNLLPAGWSATKVKPAATRSCHRSRRTVTANALLHCTRCAPRSDDAGPNLTKAQLATFAIDADPLRILKADVLCTLAAGATDEQLATLLAVTFHHVLTRPTPASRRPRIGRPSNALVNFLASRKAIRFENGAWTADFAVMRTALNELAPQRSCKSNSDPERRPRPRAVPHTRQPDAGDRPHVGDDCGAAESDARAAIPADRCHPERSRGTWAADGTIAHSSCRTPAPRSTLDSRSAHDTRSMR